MPSGQTAGLGAIAHREDVWIVRAHVDVSADGSAGPISKPAFLAHATFGRTPVATTTRLAGSSRAEVTTRAAPPSSPSMRSACSPRVHAYALGLHVPLYEQDHLRIEKRRIWGNTSTMLTLQSWPRPQLLLAKASALSMAMRPPPIITTWRQAPPSIAGFRASASSTPWRVMHAGELCSRDGRHERSAPLSQHQVIVGEQYDLAAYERSRLHLVVLTIAARRLHLVQRLKALHVLKEHRVAQDADGRLHRVALLRHITGDVIGKAASRIGEEETFIQDGVGLSASSFRILAAALGPAATPPIIKILLAAMGTSFSAHPVRSVRQPMRLRVLTPCFPQRPACSFPHPRPAYFNGGCTRSGSSRRRPRR